MRQQDIASPNGTSAFAAHPKHHIVAFAARENVQYARHTMLSIIQHLLHNYNTTACLWIFLCAGLGSASSLTPSLHTVTHAHTINDQILIVYAFSFHWVHLSILRRTSFELCNYNIFKLTININIVMQKLKNFLKIYII